MNASFMPISDVLLVVQWWGALFLIGAAAFPLARRFFSSWHDEGYVFSKAVGMAVAGWIVYVSGTLHIIPFTPLSIIFALAAMFLIGLFVQEADHTPRTSVRVLVRIVLEEVLFFTALLYWSWIKAHEPSIRGLEKFMDYGFMQSIMNTRYFPPADMWYPPYPINYYYFGHLVTALVTKLAGMNLSVTFNLMLATIFAFCLTMSFGIGFQLAQYMFLVRHIGKRMSERNKRIASWVSAAVTAYIVTLGGNMQTIYAFTQGYVGDQVRPFWEIWWNIPQVWQVGGIDEVLGKIGQGMNTYWYANATRFIPYTIHEFPSYSFVVSDVHGHVLSIPFVLLTIAFLVEIFGRRAHAETGSALHTRSRKMSPGLLWVYDRLLGASTLRRRGFRLSDFIMYGFLCGVLLMTNALDGPVYFGLFAVLLFIWFVPIRKFWQQWLVSVSIAGAVTALTSLPFLSHFSSFVSGVAVNCPPLLFANTKIGPLMFETVDKCQKSPFWMMWLLWGFFWFSFVVFVYLVFRSPQRQANTQKRLDRKVNKGFWGSFVYMLRCAGFWIRARVRRFVFLWEHEYTAWERVLIVFFSYSTLLLIFPEFFYFKDIYPQHFRSNTMFKLGYQAFIMMSIASVYTILAFITGRFSDEKKPFGTGVHRIVSVGIGVILVFQLALVSIYPLFSVRSYFGALRTYYGLYGLGWLENEYPDDAAAIEWLHGVVSNDTKYGNGISYTLVEADGESYTDYNHTSVFTGIPSVVGWAVHEWLWRGSYDAVSPRREDVRRIYESPDIDETRDLLMRYRVRFVVVGTFEREKFLGLNEWKFDLLGQEVFRQGVTVIYQMTGI